MTSESPTPPLVGSLPLDANSTSPTQPPKPLPAGGSPQPEAESPEKGAQHVDSSAGPPSAHSPDSEDLDVPADPEVSSDSEGQDDVIAGGWTDVLSSGELLFRSVAMLRTPSTEEIEELADMDLIDEDHRPRPGTLVTVALRLRLLDPASAPGPGVAMLEYHPEGLPEQLASAGVFPGAPLPEALFQEGGPLAAMAQLPGYGGPTAPGGWSVRQLLAGESEAVSAIDMCIGMQAIGEYAIVRASPRFLFQDSLPEGHPVYTHPMEIDIFLAGAQQAGMLSPDAAFTLEYYLEVFLASRALAVGQFWMDLGFLSMAQRAFTKIKGLLKSVGPDDEWPDNQEEWIHLLGVCHRPLPSLKEHLRLLRGLESLGLALSLAGQLPVPDRATCDRAAQALEALPTLRSVCLAHGKILLAAGRPDAVLSARRRSATITGPSPDEALHAAVRTHFPLPALAPVTDDDLGSLYARAEKQARAARRREKDLYRGMLQGLSYDETPRKKPGQVASAEGSTAKESTAKESTAKESTAKESTAKESTAGRPATEKLTTESPPSGKHASQSSTTEAPSMEEMPVVGTEGKATTKQPTAATSDSDACSSEGPSTTGAESSSTLMDSRKAAEPQHFWRTLSISLLVVAVLIALSTRGSG
ncbi:hypothetical protein H696_03437 [Fonticula alba]|uniref:Uncharacterized protein n=1 Tax=Fonticula alba TaxID=691883 RepID=A0A058Z906_FONAL|nr:hypothetical protein H696_03437 [Fonticula alba]KCV69972.1 hypothetical protein H696_03437 [Fonticula alba]|eukprot:XP_009495578.1 hypothetical protein H696_03437 [Fonticula alba]